MGIDGRKFLRGPFYFHIFPIPGLFLAVNSEEVRNKKRIDKLISLYINFLAQLTPLHILLGIYINDILCKKD